MFKYTLIITLALSGSLLLTPTIFLAEDTSNQVSVWERTHTAGFGCLLAGLAATGAGLTAATKTCDFIVASFDGRAAISSDTVKILANTTNGLLYSGAALCAAKACSNTTWSEILRTKKTALLKFLIAGTLSFMASKEVNGLYNNGFFNKGWNISPNLPGLGKTLMAGSFAGKYLHDVLKTPKIAAA